METESPDVVVEKPTDASKNFLKKWKDNLSKVDYLSVYILAWATYQTVVSYSDGDMRNAMLWGVGAGLNAIGLGLRGIGALARANREKLATENLNVGTTGEPTPGPAPDSPPPTDIKT